MKIVNDKFQQEILNTMYTTLDSQQMDKLKNCLWMVMSKYQVIENVKEDNSLSTYVDNNDIAVKEFCQTKLIEGKSESSIKMYKLYVNKLLDYLHKDIKEITTRDIRGYLVFHQTNYNNTTGKELSKATIQNMIRSFSSFFNWLEDEEYIQKSPARKLKSVKLDKRIKKPFSDEEIVKIKESCTNNRDLALVEFLNSTGCRVSEVAKLTLSDVDLASGKCNVIGKGNKERVVYINDVCIYQVKKYLQSKMVSYSSNEPLFSSLRQNVTMSKDSIESVLKRIGERADVKNVHPHRFRRTLACKLIDRNVPIQDVQKILGHESIKTTMIYVSCIDDKLIEINQKKFS